MFEDNTYKTHEVHNDLCEALQKSVELDYSNQRLADQEEAHKKKRKTRESPRTPPGSPPTQPPISPPTAGASGVLGTSGASGSSQLPLPPPLPSTADILEAQELSPTDYLMQDDSILEERVLLSDDEDSENDHQPKADLRKDCGNHYLKRKDQRLLNLPGLFLLPTSQMLPKVWRCHLPLVPDGGVSQDAYSLDLEYLRYGKGSNPTLSISKIKAASYPDFGLELLVPEQIWIDDMCTYDISEKYGISYSCVVRIKAYSRYAYDYLSKIVLRRADLQEHTIAEKDFKNLYPSDFEDLNLLLLQGYLDHLPGSTNECYLLLSKYGLKTW
ncbi:hypothetical protein Tco_1234591 [Tanacetum coccineum]